MTLHHVFSIASLQACLTSAGPSWFARMPGAECRGWQVERVELGDTVHFVHESDEGPDRRIVIMDQEDEGVANGRWKKKTVLERIHRAAIVAGLSRMSLPREWHAYHHDNLFSFFGSPRDRSDKTMRWTAEIRPKGNPDVLFWRLVSEKHFITLESFRPDHSRYEDAVAFWDEAVAEARSRFGRTSPRTPSLSPTVALEATFNATAGGRTYSEWLPHLSHDQARFLDKKPPVKLRGPAGTGKTLCLLLKAVREVTEARKRGQRCRILFLTHSWAMEAQVDHLLETMGEEQAVKDIDVFPLFSAGSMLMDSKLPPGLRSLGEDSHAGKQEQMVRVRALIARALSTDWPAYRSRCRADFAEAVESAPDSDQHLLFAWGVLNEFACVLGPEGIVPRGYSAGQEYRELPRSSWMMSLETDGEKDFVLGLYGDYVDGLRQDNLISADQVVNDFVKDLEKSSWQAHRRMTDGYDLIFVDELHLFNEQERRALHHLSRDPSVYPKMFMALDPRQSAEMVYTGVSGRALTREDSAQGSQALGEVEQLSLTRIHRFGREVLGLLRHINKSWPQLDLGEDWELDLDQVGSDGAATEVPRLHHHITRQDEATAALRSCRTWASRSENGRIAVVLVDREALDLYAETAAQTDACRLNVLTSRDDVASLQYEKRTVVLGPAEYVAGLQFDTVIVAGLPRMRRGAGWPQTRYLLSQLYLAISRASSHVEIHVNTDSGKLPEVLESALKSGHLRRAE
ncbi:hypothetical protein [Symbioplanes lichenis]|uniref:hypothetical protein n=1 Tax=Symbioplanes lichenis TaxID=1629072 RepID=UPI00273A114A|nr:hypothetical protein [Actinoplanes lichenis]